MLSACIYLGSGDNLVNERDKLPHFGVLHSSICCVYWEYKEQKLLAGGIVRIHLGDLKRKSGSRSRARSRYTECSGHGNAMPLNRCLSFWLVCLQCTIDTSVMGNWCTHVPHLDPFHSLPCPSHLCPAC